jgi:hypothetical protein
MAKLVIQTQYRENYAAQNEDYVHGVDNTYWKNKGGSTYVLPHYTGNGELGALTKLIVYGNPASEEFIIDCRIEEENTAKVCESWETFTEIFENTPGVFNALKITDNREDGYMRSEILEMTEGWTMLPNSERSGYRVQYLTHDGDIQESQSELREYLESQEVA